MNVHSVLQGLFLDSSPMRMADPGSGGTIRVDRQLAVVPVKTAGAEARTLSAPEKSGIFCCVLLDVADGALTLTVTGGYNQGGDTSLTFDTAGDWVLFYSIEAGTTYTWRVVAYEGVSTMTLAERTVTTLTATTANVTNATVTTANITTATITNPKQAVTASNAANSAINNATVLSAGINIIGAADNTKAVKLPVAAAGLEVWVRSTTASKTLPVFPQENAQIDALGANNAFTMPAGTLGPKCVFKAQNATQWWSFPLDNT